MTEILLAKVFETALQRWADNQDLKVAFPNVTFEPPRDAIYARVDQLPATTVDSFVEGGHEAHTGFFQVSIIGPKGRGVGPLRDMALTLKPVFRSQSVLTSGSFKVQITGPVSLGPIINDPEGAKPARCTLPCSIFYRADIVT